MGPCRHLLVAGALIGLGLVARTGGAQEASPRPDLYFTEDPAQATCGATGIEPIRCTVVMCNAQGKACACPITLPNGWKQPFTPAQCLWLARNLRPLPPVEVKPKAPSPAKQVEKGKDEDRTLYTVRLQAQGNGVEESVVLMGPAPITVAAGLQGLEALKGKLSRKELLVRTNSFRRAERMIRSAPPLGVGPPGDSFNEVRGSKVRVDVEVIRGINFRE